MKGDHMGILAAYPTQRELPLSNWARFSFIRPTVGSADHDAGQIYQPCTGELFRHSKDYPHDSRTTQATARSARVRSASRNAPMYGSDDGSGSRGGSFACAGPAIRTSRIIPTRADH